MTGDAQAALVGAIWGPAQPPATLAADLASLGLQGLGPHAAARGFAAYREHAKALAVRALGAAYPRVQTWLGAADFAGLAWLFARQHPPRCGELGQWGAELPEFLSSMPAMEPEPPALARLDWALHQMSSAADELPAEDLLARLQSGEGLDAPLRMSRSLRGLTLPPAAWAVACEVAAPQWPAVGVDVLAWRSGWQPCWASVPAAWVDWLGALVAGQPLGAAIEQTLHRWPDFEPGRALHAALQQAWILDLAA